MMGFEPKPPLYRPFQALEETIEIFRTTKKNLRIYIHRLLTFIVNSLVQNSNLLLEDFQILSELTEV
jgi:hypothetical protein